MTVVNNIQCKVPEDLGTIWMNMCLEHILEYDFVHNFSVELTGL